MNEKPQACACDVVVEPNSEAADEWGIEPGTVIHYLDCIFHNAQTCVVCQLEDEDGH